MPFAKGFWCWLVPLASDVYKLVAYDDVPLAKGAAARVCDKAEAASVLVLPVLAPVCSWCFEGLGASICQQRRWFSSLRHTVWLKLLPTYLLSALWWYYPFGFCSSASRTSCP